MTKKAIVLLSGGLDSSVTAFIAKNQGYDIYSLTFDYGQQHEKEIEAAADIAHALQSKKHIKFDINIDIFGGSSLLQKSSDTVPSASSLSEIGSFIPSTYVPARNTIFLSIALSYAETQQADAIFIGVTAADYSGYPDCRPEYIRAFHYLTTLATKRTVQGHLINLKTPVIEKTKTQIILEGSRLGVPFEKTWSCYLGKAQACGRCESCFLRLKGFQDAGIPDPLPYKEFPDWYTLEP